MWIILFGFREFAVELEGSPVINRRTPRMGHWIYSSTIRNLTPDINYYLTYLLMVTAYQGM